MGPNKPEAGAKSMTDVPAQPKPVPAAGTADRCQRHDLLVKIGDLASRLSFWRVRLFGLVPSKCECATAEAAALIITPFD
jgi:hypothetical protein